MQLGLPWRGAKRDAMQLDFASPQHLVRGGSGLGQRLEADELRPGESGKRKERKLAARRTDIQHRRKLSAESHRRMLERGKHALPQPWRNYTPQSRLPHETADLRGSRASSQHAQ